MHAHTSDLPANMGIEETVMITQTLPYDEKPEHTPPRSGLNSWLLPEYMPISRI